MSPFRATAVCATALLVGCFFQGCNAGGTAKAASLKPDKQRHAAPDFSLKDADGKIVHLADYKGKVVLLDFWATWCPPCKVEIPWFIDIQRKNKDKGFEVLGIAMDDNGWEDVKPFLAQMKINYRVVVGDDATSQAYGDVESLPTTFLIDKQGRIAAIHIGLDASRKEFEEGVQELLQENPSDVTNLPGNPVRASALVPEQH